MNFDPTLLIGWITVFVFSVTAHEAAHAWFAKRTGMASAYISGKVTLNPWPHIRREPFGMVLLPVMSLLVWNWPVGFAGAAHDPDWADQYPKKAAVMSLAGPAANLFISLSVLLVLWIGLKTGVFHIPNTITIHQLVAAPAGSVAYGMGILLSMLVTVNFLLFLINLAPVPPLDGAGILAVLLRHETHLRYQRFMSQPMLSVIGVFIVWYLLGFVFYPVFRWYLLLLSY